MEIFPGILRKFKDFSRKENSSKISRTSRTHMHQVPIEVVQFSIIRNTGIRFIDTLKELHTVKMDQNHMMVFCWFVKSSGF